jgi:CBS domain containing-hemolysin-like protein
MNEHVRALLAPSACLLITVWATAVWTALSGLTRGRLRRLDAVKQADLVKRAESWLDARDRIRLTVRIFNVVGIGLGAATIANAYPSQAMIALSAWLVVYLLAAEILGALAAKSPWLYLSASIPAMRIISFVAAPVILPLHALGEGLAKLEQDDEDEHPSTADEIVSLVEQDAQQEANGTTGLEDNERRMILGVMDLDETLAKEIMTPRVDVQAIPSTSTVAELKNAIVESGHSRVPVYDATVDDIVGIIYSRDLHDEKRLRKGAGIRTLMHEPVFVPETKPVADLLEELKQKKVHMAIVIDEYGGTAGLVTIEDILEEIVGEIRDEYDQDEEDLICTIDNDGIATVDARVPIDEINELLSVNLSLEEDYDTVGGYVASELGRIPKTGEEFAFGNLRCTILAADQRKIARLQLHCQTTDD